MTLFELYTTPCKQGKLGQKGQGLQLDRVLTYLQLLRAGAQVHHVSKDGRSTALHEAVLRSHGDLAELLLKASANPFLENGSGET